MFSIDPCDETPGWSKPKLCWTGKVAKPPFEPAPAVPFRFARSPDTRGCMCDESYIGGRSAAGSVHRSPVVRGRLARGRGL
eukprot:14853216-Heterocapsa_arctica.AAC.1